MVALSKDQIIQKAKSSIREASVDEVKKRWEKTPDLLVVDVREADEVETGKVKGAVHIPRGFLELKIEEQVPDKSQELILH